MLWDEGKRPTGCLEQAAGWLSQQAVQIADSVLVWEQPGLPHSAGCAL